GDRGRPLALGQEDHVGAGPQRDRAGRSGDLVVAVADRDLVARAAADDDPVPGSGRDVRRALAVRVPDDVDRVPVRGAAGVTDDRDVRRARRDDIVALAAAGERRRVVVALVL